MTTATTTDVDRITELAQAGEPTLATIEAIRLLAAIGDGDDMARSHLLNAVGVLRYSEGDRVGAAGCLRAAAAAHPGNVNALESLAAVEAELREHGANIGSDAEVTAGVGDLSPWVVEALDRAEALVGLADRDVLEVGGSVPRGAAASTGARRWVAVDLIATAVTSPGYEVHDADVAHMPFPDDSFDVAWSSCAFEHFPDLDAALAEVRRVLRPGGVLFAKYAPIWSCSIGHHLWVETDDGTRLSFSDPVIPRWGHLLLDEPELEHYLATVFGPGTGRRGAEFVYGYDGLNRCFEFDHRRAFAASGMAVEVLEPWRNDAPPTPALSRALHERHPSGGDFGTFGFTVVLRKV